jgi:transposase
VEPPFTKAGLIELRKLALPEGAKYVLGQKVERLVSWKEAGRKMEREVRRRIPIGDREQWLMSIPGVGPCTGRWLANVLGDVKRFPDGRHVASYLGRVPSERTSCTEPRRGRITKAGNVWLRWLLVQCAWRSLRATRSDPRGYWREMYLGLVARGKSKKRAIVAVANRLARVAYAVLRDGRMYEHRGSSEEERPKKTYVLKETIRPAAP